MIFAVTIAAMLIGHNIHAQRVMNDPSYSSNNYKHPNKAAYVKKQQENQPVVYLEEVKDGEEKEENSLTASGNYKGMSPAKSKIKKFRVTSAPSYNPAFVPSSSGNYKQQFAPRQRKSQEKVKQTEETPIVQNN